MKVLIVLGLLAGVAHADEDYGGGTIIFARGGSLYRVSATGKNETEIAKLPDKAVVRALRTDASGKILLADLGGKWSYLPLDGSVTTLTELPCAAGPAQLADDASCLLCRSAADANKTVLYSFAKDKWFPIPVPPVGARLTNARSLVWADDTGVWSAPLDKPGDKAQLASDAPARGFLASPDGTHAVGVYHDEVFTDAHHKKPADLVMGFALDGTAARRKLGPAASPVEWSHDSQWILVQEATEACVVRLSGGEYRCFSGFTGESMSSDGRWTLLLGNRDPKGKAPAITLDASDDVAAAPPAGSLALYRGRLEGLYPEAPVIVVKNVDGAAVWVPKSP